MSKMLKFISASVLVCAWLTVLSFAQNNDMTLPSGTEISVRTNEAIDSTSSSANTRYTAEVVNDVKGAGGEVLIPRGSPAELVVKNMSKGGTVGSSEVVLDLNSVTVNGRHYLVSTEDVNRSGNQGIGKNKRTAEMVGGGAVLGTLLGAVAGGGKGAAIGAVAGAAAGGTAQVLTRGKEVKVPAETVLNFKLDQPLRMRSAPGY